MLLVCWLINDSIGKCRSQVTVLTASCISDIADWILRSSLIKIVILLGKYYRLYLTSLVSTFFLSIFFYVCVVIAGSSLNVLLHYIYNYIVSNKCKLYCRLVDACSPLLSATAITSLGLVLPQNSSIIPVYTKILLAVSKSSWQYGWSIQLLTFLFNDFLLTHWLFLSLPALLVFQSSIS